jgi:beta-lactamase class A
LLAPTSSLAVISAGTSWKDELNGFGSGYTGRIGTYAFDRGTGTTLTYRGDELFLLLSTFKVLAGAAVLRKARHCRGDLLDQVVHWTEADLVEYPPITEQYVDTGMTVAELCPDSTVVAGTATILARALGY